MVDAGAAVLRMPVESYTKRFAKLKTGGGATPRRPQDKNTLALNKPWLVFGKSGTQLSTSAPGLRTNDS